MNWFYADMDSLIESYYERKDEDEEESNEAR